MPSHLIRLYLLAAATLLFFAAGCSLTSGANVTGRTVTGADGVSRLETKINYLNPFLMKQIKVGGIVSGRSGEVMTMQTTLESLSDQTQTINYRVTWFDANGVAADRGAASWTPLVISGRSSAFIQSAAPTPAATAFILDLRSAD